MKTNSRRSNSAVALMELLIIIAVFAVCCTAGLKAIMTADSEQSYAEQLSAATNIASDIAEQYKAGTDISELNDTVSHGYEKKIFEGKENNTLHVTLNERFSQDGSVSYLDITVSDDKYTYTQITCARTSGGEPNG